jgi:hypothetical protein
MTSLPTRPSIAWLHAERVVTEFGASTRRRRSFAMQVRSRLFGGHSIVHMFSPVRRRGPTREPMALAPAEGTRYRSGRRQARWSRLLLLTKAAVSGPRLDRPLAAGLDDEKQPAHHGNAVAADRRRRWNSRANVALLRLPRCDSVRL